MQVPDEIARLVELFEQNGDSYLKGHYNETQLRLLTVSSDVISLLPIRGHGGTLLAGA